jgi:hypothetical protein
MRTVSWLFVWTVSWVVANIAIKKNWAATWFPAPLFAVVPTILGIVMIFAYWRFLREADELQCKIQLEALAVGFGAGLVGGYTIHLLSRAGVLTSIEISEVAAFMMVVYAVATLVGERRYA